MVADMQDVATVSYMYQQGRRGVGEPFSHGSFTVHVRCIYGACTVVIGASLVLNFDKNENHPDGFC